MAIKTVGVLGCGLMGSGIAQVSAAAGFKTLVLEVNQGVLDKGLARVKKFLDDGGTILAVGRSAMNLAEIFELPVDNHLVERTPDGTTRALPSEKFYVPGSVLRVAVDTTAPIAHAR